MTFALRELGEGLLALLLGDDDWWVHRQIAKGLHAQWEAEDVAR